MSSIFSIGEAYLSLITIDGGGAEEKTLLVESFLC